MADSPTLHTPQQVEQWAREVDANELQQFTGGSNFCFSVAALTRFAALVAQAERERCCVAAGNERVSDTLDEPEDVAYNLAITHVIEAIRNTTGG